MISTKKMTNILQISVAKQVFFVNLHIQCCCRKKIKNRLILDAS